MAKNYLTCDICGTLITIHAPLHRCKPDLAHLVRLVPGYKTMSETEQVKWLESLLYGLGKQVMPQWWPTHAETIKRIIAKYG